MTASRSLALAPAPAGHVAAARADWGPWRLRADTYELTCYEAGAEVYAVDLRCGDLVRTVVGKIWTSRLLTLASSQALSPRACEVALPLGAGTVDRECDVCGVTYQASARRRGTAPRGAAPGPHGRARPARRQRRSSPARPMTGRSS